MPSPGTLLEFIGWSKNQRHPIVFFADFEALLVKCTKNKGGNTSAFQKHKTISYGFIAKPSEYVPLELLNQYSIPTIPVIFRGSQSDQNVSRHFIECIVKVTEKIEKLLKSNTPIKMTEEQHRSHNISILCNLCKNTFSNKNYKMADYCHLSGEF